MKLKFIFFINLFILKQTFFCSIQIKEYSAEEYKKYAIECAEQLKKYIEIYKKQIIQIQSLEEKCLLFEKKKLNNDEICNQLLKLNTQFQAINEFDCQAFDTKNKESKLLDFESQYELYRKAELEYFKQQFALFKEIKNSLPQIVQEIKSINYLNICGAIGGNLTINNIINNQQSIEQNKIDNEKSQKIDYEKRLKPLICFNLKQITVVIFLFIILPVSSLVYKLGLPLFLKSASFGFFGSGQLPISSNNITINFCDAAMNVLKNVAPINNS